MSGSKSFTGSNAEVSYQFTHLTAQEFLAAWYAAIVLSVEEQSKLFIEKAGDDRFRMMLLFLAGITGLQDTQVYQQIMLKSYQQLIEPELRELKEKIDYEEIQEKQLQLKEEKQLILRRLQERNGEDEEEEEHQLELQLHQLELQLRQLQEEVEQHHVELHHRLRGLHFNTSELQKAQQHMQQGLQQLREQQQQGMELQQILDKAHLQPKTT